MTDFEHTWKLIDEAIQSCKLNLDGTTVLTEAATGHFFVTPVIAAMAGAKVIAIAKDSVYGKSFEAIEQIRTYVENFNIGSSIEYHDALNESIISKTDIVTNLGFVRPIDATFIKSMHKGAVVSLFCEPWEVRPKDVDLKSCAENSIPVMGTNEHAPGLNVFSNTGPLIFKMILEGGVEVSKNNFLLISGDKFGDEIKRALQQNNAHVDHVNPRNGEINLNNHSQLDVVIIADYTFDGEIISGDGILKPTQLKEKFPQAKIIHLAGKLSEKIMQENAIDYLPKQPGYSYKMSRTFAHLGIKPVIDLHTAGLKVGEVLFKARQKYTEINEVLNKAKAHPYCKPVGFNE